MRIIGMDPGYAISGFGVIDYNNGRFKVVDYGVVTTDSHLLMSDRLKIIYESYLELIDLHQPDEAAIEELFFNTNSKTVIAVGQARGVHILASINRGIEIYEYTPLQIKQGLVGYGRAEKKQVQEMVKIMLNLSAVPRPDDAADALAVAICHAHSIKSKELFKL